MRYLKFYEKINPEDFNTDYIEDPEDEEDDDDIYQELSDDLIGGDVYRGTFSFILLSPKNGQIEEIKFQTFNQNTSDYGWYSRGINKRWPYTGKFLFDINLNVEKLNVVGKTKTGSLQLVSTEGKKTRFSISPNALFKGDKLSNYYVRSNDVLAFDKESLSEGLQILYQKYIKLFEFGYKHSLSKPQIDKKLETATKKIKSIKYKLEGIEFVLDNIDKTKSYLDKRTVENDKKTFERSIIITEKNIKQYSDIDTVDIETSIKQKIENLG